MATMNKMTSAVRFRAPRAFSCKCAHGVGSKVAGIASSAMLASAAGLDAGSGHFHVLIDDPKQYEEGEAIPFDDTHKHYGKGQTAADIDLTPGKHTLTLQFANALHESYGQRYAKTITLQVADN